MADDIQYKLGELSQFKADVCTRLEAIERKVDDLRSWKLKTIGFISGIYMIITVIWSVAKDKFLQ
jgi:hypothetical protein